VPKHQTSTILILPHITIDQQKRNHHGLLGFCDGLLDLIRIATTAGVSGATTAGVSGATTGGVSGAKGKSTGLVGCIKVELAGLSRALSLALAPSASYPFGKRQCDWQSSYPQA
jgi:hypothetical protein